jgi:biotin operon repressor
MTAVLPFLTRRPQTKRELAERMGVPARTVEELVNEARHAGKAIISDSDGYRLTDDPDEVDAMVRRLRVRAAHQFGTARALRATARRMRERDDALRNGTLWDPEDVAA